jgi:hypothetical protein
MPTKDFLEALFSAQDYTAKMAALIGFLGAVIGGILTAAFPLVLDWWRAPVLDIVCVKDDDLFDMEFDQGGKRVYRKYLTVRVVNNGRTTARNCRLYLKDIQKVHINGKVESVKGGTSFQLSWPGWKFDGRDIPPTLQLVVEAVSVDKSEPGWIFMFDGNERNQPEVRSYRGTYRLVLVAVAENTVPKVRELDVAYDGDWHQFYPTGIR